MAVYYIFGFSMNFQSLSYDFLMGSICGINWVLYNEYYYTIGKTQGSYRTSPVPSIYIDILLLVLIIEYNNDTNLIMMATVWFAIFS